MAGGSELSAETPTIVVARGSRPYLLLVGVVIGMLVAGLAVPLVFGESITSAPNAADDAALSLTDDGTTDLEAIGAPTDGNGDVDRAGAPAADTGTAAGAASGTGVSGSDGNAGPGAATAPAAGSPEGDGLSASAPSQPSALTASDRGVSPTTIKLGFTLLDIQTVGRLGVAVAIDPAQQQAAFQSFVDDINARGGIHGRKIEAHFRAYDVTDRNDQIAACRELTQDKGVFAVLGGFNIVDPNLCVVQENQTPLISSATNNPDWVVARSGGRLVSTYPRSGRMMAGLVAEMERTGLAAKKIGILTDGLNDPGGQVADQLEALLEARGRKVVYRGQLSDDIPTASSQVPVEVNRARTADATGAEVIVFLSSNAVFGTQFVNQADSQNYRPQYVNSDWASNSGDTTNQNMPSSYAGRAFAFSFGRGLSSKRPLMPPPPEADRCRDIYNARSGRKLAEPANNEYGLSMGYCDLVRIFERLATATGPQLTRAALVGAVPKAGSFASAAFSPGSFGPNKHDMADLVRVERWAANCGNNRGCWEPVGGFHRPGG